MVDNILRKLGTTDLLISPIGLGTAGLGGNNWSGSIGSQSELDSITTVRAALDEGINWIDTAPTYGLGQSEYLLGKILREIPSNKHPYIFTKCGEEIFEGTNEKQRMNFSRNSLIKQVDDSLRRLGIERIDMLTVHHQSHHVSNSDDYWQTMNDLRQSGKVRYIGLSNHDLDRIKKYQSIGIINSIQIPMSIINRSEYYSKTDWCFQQKIGIVAYSVLETGLLTGNFSIKKQMQLADWRKFSKEFNQENLIKNIAICDTLRTIASNHNVTVSAVAANWTLAFQNIDGIILGARDPEKVKDWSKITQFILSPEELNEIKNALIFVGNANGPTLPESSSKKVVGINNVKFNKIIKKNMRKRFNSIISSIYGPMIVNIHDTGVANEIFKNGQFVIGEIRELNLIMDHLCSLNKFVRCLDIGANIGIHTMVMAERLTDVGIVVAFEPQRIVYQMLNGNVSINSHENVFCLQKAVGSSLGELKIPNVDYGKPCNFGGIDFLDKHDSLSQNNNSLLTDENVEMISIDSLDYDSIDFIKIDAEGMELEILKGASESIKKYRPIMAIEYIRTDVQLLIQVITSLGYRISAFQEQGVFFCAPNESNFNFPNLPRVKP